MAETATFKSEVKRGRQPISVPFIWEEKPGTPKKDWLTTARPTKLPPPAVKLVVSVPFGWEEKPGTPLPSFAQPPKEPVFVASQEHSSIFFSSPPKYSDHDYRNDNEGDDGSSDTYSIDTDESFTSAKSLLANGLISTTAIASAVPCLALTTTTDHEQQLQSPASETESTSSYATGTASLVGAPFLEWLFPLLVPNKVGYLERDPSHKEETNSRPLLTLGELIVMSRRRSCQRKVMKMHKQKSVDFMKRNAFGCCISGIGNGINEFHIKWKRQLQLKLM